jgi:hypothetical protein
MSLFPVTVRTVSLVAVALSAGVALGAGVAAASSPARVKANSCPAGYQIDPQNSQQCLPQSPPGPESAATGCTTAGYNLTGSSPDTCVDANGRDTWGQQH